MLVTQSSPEHVPPPATPVEHQPKKRTGLIVAAAVAGVVVLIALTATITAALAGHGSGTNTAAAEPTSTSARHPADSTAEPAAEPTPTTPAPAPSLTPTVNESCVSSTAWAQEGETSILDAYINNQSSGNIKVDELTAGCPQFVPLWQRAQGGIGGGGAHAVPGEVNPGTYETTSADLESCYWERARNGQTLDNNFVTASKAKIRVTIRAGDDTFISKGCGNWVKV